MTRRTGRRFGQHFLEPAWVRRLVQIVKPVETDTFLEVGAGEGALTIALAATGARVTAVEIDRRLVAELERVVPESVTVVAGDFLTLDLARLPGLSARPLRVVGNLPYSVGSPILVKLLRFSEHGAHVTDAVLMLQREVADRVVAKPGTPDWGPLAVLVQIHADATRVLTIPPGAFRPMPKVRSAVVTLRFRATPVRILDPVGFDLMVRNLFTQRRKTAVNALRRHVAQVSRLTAEEVFAHTGVDPRCRPGQLELAELAELAAVLASSRN